MDQALLIYLNQTLAHPILDILAVGLTTVGFALLPGLGFAALFRSRQRIGVAILIALLVGFLITLIFQYLGFRPRPPSVRLILQQPNFPSFPSGHAVAAFSTAMIISLATRNLVASIAIVCAAVLIALSRVYLGHHYPSDILGGSVMGLALGATAYGLIISRQQESSSSQQFIWQWFLWPQLAIVLLASQMAYLDILPNHLLQWPFADKVIHFLLFGALAFWLNLWLRGRAVKIRSWTIPLALLVLITFAVGEESLQGLSPLRTLGIGDLISNILGLMTFWWLSQKILKRHRDTMIPR